MLISAEHRKLNEQLHDSEDFGASGHRWSETVAWIINSHNIKRVLDYGAGKQTLRRQLAPKFSDVDFFSYDPAVRGLSEIPPQVELVTCTDVLEHVEPQRLNDVLDHLQYLTTRLLFLAIPTGPAGKNLSDGRNAHLIQEKLSWWLPKLLKRFDLVFLNNMTSDIVVLLQSKKKPIGFQVFLVSVLQKFQKDFRVLSVTFDGLALCIFVKAYSWRARFAPRMLSVFKLGKRMGVAELDVGSHRPIRLIIVKF